MRILHIFMLFLFSTQAQSIVRGSLVPNNSFLSKIIIKIETEHHPEIFCTSVIVGTNKLVTARHCMQNEFLNQNQYQLSIARFKNQSIRIKNVNLFSNADLAIVELDENIPKAYQAIPIIKFEDIQHDIMIISGFGKSDSNLKPDGQLRYGKLLKSRYWYNENLIKIQLAPNQPSACGGDSGGALIGVKDNQFYLVGIIIATGAGCSVFNGFLQPAHYLK